MFHPTPDHAKMDGPFGEGPAADPRRLPEVFPEAWKVCVCVPFVLDSDLLKPGSYQRQTWQQLSPFSISSFFCQEAIGVEYDPRGTPSLCSSRIQRVQHGLCWVLPAAAHTRRYSFLRAGFISASMPRICFWDAAVWKFRSEAPRDRGPEITPRDLDSR